MAGRLPGYIWGFVVDTDDPEKLGRCRIEIPGMFEPYHPDWIFPLGWPGGGGTHGGRYPIQEEAQVAVFFEHGNLEGSPVFLPGPYATLNGVVEGPPVVAADAADEDKDVRDLVVLWSDADQAIFLKRTKDARAFVIRDNISGSNITMNMSDGGQKKSVTISIQAQTQINLRSSGAIHINGDAGVFIQGRPVVGKGTI